MLRAMAYPRTCLRWAWLTAATVALGACGDDGSSEGGGDDSAASTSTTSPATDTGPATSAGTTDPDPTLASASASGDTTSTGGGMTSTTSGADSSGGTETGTVDCASLDETACMDEPACMAIGGQPIVSGAEGSCLDPSEYFECQPVMACGEALTYACQGDDAPLYQFPTTCIPSTFMDCGPPPPVDLRPC